MTLTERLQNRYIAEGDALAKDALDCLKAADKVIADLLRDKPSQAAKKRAADLLKALRS